MVGHLTPFSQVFLEVPVSSSCLSNLRPQLRCWTLLLYHIDLQLGTLPCEQLIYRSIRHLDSRSHGSTTVTVEVPQLVMQWLAVGEYSGYKA